MKTKIFFLITIMSITICSYSQEMRTLFSDNKSKTDTYGGYGGPLISTTQMNGSWGLMFGGKGGLVINQKIAIGGIGMALVSNNTFVGGKLNENTKEAMDLTYGAGGIFVEYIFKLGSPVHFSIPLNLMAGGVSINDVNTAMEIESSYAFVLEPGINIEFNVAKQFIPAINISYRQAFGISMVNVSNKDLSGLNIGLIFKFGYFK